jgi:pimeloyl-ACP methyl ester carboxylesterase
MNENADLGEVGAPIDFAFMAEMIRNEVKAFNQLIDPYDNPEHPAPGYTWDMKIFHPGSTPGQLPPDGGPYPVIVFCNGATGSEPAYSSAMDWMGTYYAQKGYIFAIPVFIGNDAHFDEKPFYEISTDIYELQAITAIDFLQERFSRFKQHSKRLIDTRHVTIIGYSQGGHVAQKTAAQDRRVARLCLLSSVFIYYQSAWAGFLLDAKDTYDVLNTSAKERGMALHVQRFTKPVNQSACPDWDPECDWIPPVDGFLTRVDLSQDPWEPYLCDGESCGVRDGTYYNHLLYEGPKEEEIRNNGLIDHGGLASPEPENDAGRALALQYLDEFFAQFPVE